MPENNRTAQNEPEDKKDSKLEEQKKPEPVYRPLRLMRPRYGSNRV